MKNLTLSKRGATTGFSLLELMIALAIVALLTAIAYPSYLRHITSSSRAAAQTEVGELSGMQERIYLNANAYTTSLTADYDGTATGGLGKTSGTTDDGKYTLAFTVSTAQSYTITATPVAGTTQAGDGAFSITSGGARTCDTPSSWCKNGVW